MATLNTAFRCKIIRKLHKVQEEAEGLICNSSQLRLDFGLRVGLVPLRVGLRPLEGRIGASEDRIEASWGPGEGLCGRI